MAKHAVNVLKGGDAGALGSVWLVFMCVCVFVDMCTWECFLRECRKKVCCVNSMGFSRIQRSREEHLEAQSLTHRQAETNRQTLKQRGREGREREGGRRREREGGRRRRENAGGKKKGCRIKMEDEAKRTQYWTQDKMEDKKRKSTGAKRK